MDLERVGYNLYYLGLNVFSHDTSACIFKDGKLLVAIEEERLNLKKHTREFPFKAIQLCLNYLIPNIMTHFSFKKNDVSFADSSIKYIINKYSKEDSGVRNLIKIIKNIVSKLHIIYITNNSSLVNITNNIKFPLKITKNNIKEFL